MTTNTRPAPTTGYHLAYCSACSKTRTFIGQSCSFGGWRR